MSSFHRDSEFDSDSSPFTSSNSFSSPIDPFNQRVNQIQEDFQKRRNMFFDRSNSGGAGVTTAGNSHWPYSTGFGQSPFRTNPMMSSDWTATRSNPHHGMRSMRGDSPTSSTARNGHPQQQYHHHQHQHADQGHRDIDESDAIPIPVLHERTNSGNGSGGNVTSSTASQGQDSNHQRNDPHFQQQHPHHHHSDSGHATYDHSTANQPIPNQEDIETASTLSSSSGLSHQSGAGGGNPEGGYDTSGSAGGPSSGLFRSSSGSSNSTGFSSSGGHQQQQRPGSSNSSNPKPREHIIPIYVEPRDDGVGSQRRPSPSVSRSGSGSSHSSMDTHHQPNIGSNQFGQFRQRQRSTPSPMRQYSGSNQDQACSSSSPVGSPKVIPVTVERTRSNSNSSNASSRPESSSSLFKQSAPLPGSSQSSGRRRTESESNSSNGSGGGVGPHVTRIPVDGHPTAGPDQQSNRPMSAHTPPPPPKDPMELIEDILAEVRRLEAEVEQFQGTNQDKQYRYLDEMFTRSLIKLDSIESNGRDDVRQARKGAIHYTEKCIGQLEAKGRGEGGQGDANGSSGIVSSTDNEGADGAPMEGHDEPDTGADSSTAQAAEDGEVESNEGNEAQGEGMDVDGSGDASMDRSRGHGPEADSTTMESSKE